MVFFLHYFKVIRQNAPIMFIIEQFEVVLHIVNAHYGAYANSRFILKGNRDVGYMLLAKKGLNSFNT